jgi:hypothetical protein
MNISIRSLALSALAFAFILLSLPMQHAHADDVYTDFQTWLLMTALVPVDQDKKFSFYGEVQPRIGDSSRYPERLLIRPAAVYNVSSSLSLYLGYAWTPLFMDARFNHDMRDEHRIWQQVLYTHTLSGTDFTFQHRLRQEQRFIEDTGDTGNRTRYLVRASHPFSAGGTSGLTGYNEYFVNWNDVSSGPKSGFDRNRFFLGPYLQQRITRYELGYLGEYSKHYRDGDRMIHGVLASIALKF